MAVRCEASITLTYLIDVKATYRYYKLQSSSLAAPAAPTTASPATGAAPSGWSDHEPTPSTGSTDSLYLVDLTVFTDNSYLYSKVSKSASFEAAKAALNAANAASSAASNAQQSAQNAQDKINNLAIGGRNYCVGGNKMIEISYATRDLASKDIVFRLSDDLDINGLIGKQVWLSYDYLCDGEFVDTGSNPNRWGLEVIATWSNDDGVTKTNRWPLVSFDKRSSILKRAVVGTVLTKPSDFQNGKMVDLVIKTQTKLYPTNANRLCPIFKLGHIKFEVGTKSTEWSLAVEDASIPTGENLLPRRLMFDGSLNREDNYETSTYLRRLVGEEYIPISTKLCETDEILAPYISISDGLSSVRATLSFDIVASSGTSGDIDLMLIPGEYGVTIDKNYMFKITNDTNKRFSFTFNIRRNAHSDSSNHNELCEWGIWLSSADMTMTQNAIFTISNVKIEIGETATPFAPSPADIDETIDEMGASITKLNDLIQLMVMTPDGGTMLSQDKDGMQFVFYKLLEKIAYIDSGLDADGSPYTIWGIDDGFKARVSNGSIEFLDKANNVMSIMDGNKMNVNNVEVDNSLAIFNNNKSGKYVWETRDNGNLGLLWHNA